MKLYILGTGNATVTECYNTCCLLLDEQRPAGDRCLLIDGGGGNGLLSRFKEAGVDWREVRSIFLSHRHMDHFTGILWMMRNILNGMKHGTYEGEASIYGHEEVIHILRGCAELLLTEGDCACLDDRLHLITLEDGETRTILGRETTFFDIGSAKTRQFGFQIALEAPEERSGGRTAPAAGGIHRRRTVVGQEYADTDAGKPAEADGVGPVCGDAGSIGIRAGSEPVQSACPYGALPAEAVPFDKEARRVLTFCGDEPCHANGLPYADHAQWLLFEAFCLSADAERFRPYEKGHSTVMDACKLAERLQASNLILYHTEDTDLPHRRQRYSEEGRKYYSGNLLIPDDLEIIDL